MSSFSLSLFLSHLLHLYLQLHLHLPLHFTFLCISISISSPSLSYNHTGDCCYSYNLRHLSRQSPAQLDWASLSLCTFRNELYGWWCYNWPSLKVYIVSGKVDFFLLSITLWSPSRALLLWDLDGGAILEEEEEEEEDESCNVAQPAMRRFSWEKHPTASRQLELETADIERNSHRLSGPLRTLLCATYACCFEILSELETKAVATKAVTGIEIEKVLKIDLNLCRGALRA